MKNILKDYYESPNRLINLEKLCKNYNIDKINIAYKDSNRERQKLEGIPPTIDLVAPLKIWMSYNTETDLLTVCQNLIGVDNYWITQVEDDHKNKRIDLNDYIYERK